MTRHRTTVLVLVVLLAVLSGAAPLAAAQADEATPTATPEPTPSEDSPSETNRTVTPTATPEATVTPTATATATSTPTPSRSAQTADANDTYLIEIGEHGTARVVSQDWDEDEGRVTIVLELEETQTIAVTDASIDLQEHEAHNIPQNQRRLPPGRSTLTFEVSYPNDAAVTVGSSKGGLVSLSPGNAGLFNRPSQWADVRAAGLGAGGLGLIGYAGGVWHAVSKRRVTGVEVVDQEETHD